MKTIKSIPLLTSAAVLLLAGRLPAANYQWINSNGGDFGLNTNWNPSTGVPGISDTAIFSSSTPVVSGSITSTSNKTLGTLYVNNNTFTMNFGGNVFSVANPIIGVNGATANVTFQNGDYQFTGVSYVGGNSQLKISGSTAKLTTSTRFDIGYSAGSAGSPMVTEVRVENGANYTPAANNVNIGGQVNYSEGRLRITGTGSTLSLGSATRIYVGSSGVQTGNAGLLKIDSGATGSGGTAIYLGQGAGVSGTLAIEGTGSSLTTKAVNVGGSGTVSGGTGALLVHSGGTLISTTLQNWKNGTIYVGAGSTVTADTLRNGSAVLGDEGAVLKGSGTIIATNVAVGGNMFLYGELRAGDTDAAKGTGTLTLGSVTNAANVRFYGSNTSYFDFDSAIDFDKIAITGSMRGESNDLGKLVLAFNYIPLETDTFTILTASSFTGTPAFSEIVWEGFATGGQLSYVGNSIVLSNIEAIPEPGVTVLSGIISMGALAMHFRRRRANRAKR